MAPKTSHNGSRVYCTGLVLDEAGAACTHSTQDPCREREREGGRDDNWSLCQLTYIIKRDFTMEEVSC